MLLETSAPKDLAEAIVRALPVNPVIAKCEVAPNGFVNITLSTTTLVQSIAGIASFGVVPPALPAMRVLVDFSSPNIAKEMHVGHLRSTIIGDCLARVLEFVGFTVMRTNHVGDWGTQFGMLITYLLESYPHLGQLQQEGDDKAYIQQLLQSLPNMTDLTAIYKASKKRFDEDPVFKEQSRLNVVQLQGGKNAVCRQIWHLLCEASRREFEKVYALLDVQLKEVGESFYNPLIPGTNDLLAESGLVTTDEGMLVVKLPHFSHPLILRKSDGGYGYDSTDMAALRYRLFNPATQCDWIVIVTDAGQASHFHMCFDTAKAAGWLAEAEIGRAHV